MMLYEQVYGRLTTANATDAKERFVVNHAVANVFQPTEKYNSTGTYMSFQHYEVERRAHLKCISGVEGLLRVIVLYLLCVCVLLPDCHVLEKEMKCQWFHRVVVVDFLYKRCHDWT